MFVDYREVFGNDDRGSVGFPKLVVKEFDKSLPKGLRYHSLEDGSVRVGPEEGEGFTIGGLKPMVTREIEKAIGKDPNASELLSYSYNAQKPIRMMLEKPGYITVNGVEISADEYVKNPLHRIKLDEGSFVAFPKPFPDSFDVLVGSGDDGPSIVLKVKRVPNESVNVMRFESDPNQPLVVKYSLLDSGAEVGESAPQVQFSIDIKPGRCSSLAEVTNVLSIYKSALDGNCEIAGVQIGKPNLGNRNDPVDDAMIQLFQKALAVESFLGLRIAPKNIVLNRDAAQTIEALYFGLVRCEPINTGLRNTSISLDMDLPPETEAELLESVGGQVALRYVRQRGFSMFGEEISLWSLCGVFGLSVSRIEDGPNEKKLVLEAIGEVSEGYEGWLLFRDEGSLDNYLNTVSDDDVMQRLQHAKLLQEYVDELPWALNVR